MIIKQFFDEDEIKSLAYDPKLYVIAEANDRTKMTKRKVSEIPPAEIVKLLKDNGNMFVMFEKESAICEPSTNSNIADFPF